LVILMSLPLYAILLDGGFLTKKLYLKHSRHATVDDIVAEWVKSENCCKFASARLMTA